MSLPGTRYNDDRPFIRNSETIPISQSAFPDPHFAIRNSQFAIRVSQFALRNPQSAFPNSQSAFPNPHFSEVSAQRVQSGFDRFDGGGKGKTQVAFAVFTEYDTGNGRHLGAIQ